jgi:hypothetical protein
MSRGDEWDLPDQDHANIYLQDNGQFDVEPPEEQPSDDDHWQSDSWDDSEGKRFNEECTCRECLEEHSDLEIPFPGCNCQTCINLDKRLSGIHEEYCDCEKCTNDRDQSDDDSPSVEGNSSQLGGSSKCDCDWCESYYANLATNQDVSNSLNTSNASKLEKIPSASSVEEAFQIFIELNKHAMRRGANWSLEEDDFLALAYHAGLDFVEISSRLQRTNYSILCRLAKLLLENRGVTLKPDPDFDYESEGKPWEKAESLACAALFESGRTPIGISQVLLRKPLSVAVELVKNRHLF